MEEAQGYSLTKRIALVSGPTAFLILRMVPPPTGLSPEGWATAGLGIFMCIWWISEAVPIPVTSLLPIVVLPIVGVVPVGVATSPYANPLIFLFMGGFMISAGMERWNLHRRIALHLIRIRGRGVLAIQSGFMIAAAFLSMWITNTATTLMVLPIAISVIVTVQEAAGSDYDKNFEVALLLGIAYAATLGGLGTLIGTVPNALLAGYLSETYSFELSFAQWMLIGVPIVLVSVPLVYFLLTRWIYRVRMPADIQIDVDGLLRNLGPMSKAERLVAIVFGATALLWMTRPLLDNLLPGLSDTGIAIAAAVTLFVIPVDLKVGLFVLDWKSAVRLPWGTLLLFGGGLSLARAVSESGLAVWIGNAVSGLAVLPMWMLLLIVVAVVIFLTELTSNTATAAAFLPIFAPVALAMGENPLLLLIPATIAASCAFMLPVATPPNAIVFGSERLRIAQMARAGIVLNAVFVVLITLAVYLLLPLVFGLEQGVVPDWVN